MAETRRPSSSSSDDEDLVGTPQSEVVGDHKFKSKTRASSTNSRDVKTTVSSSDERSETDIEDYLEDEEEVASFEIKMKAKEIDVGLLNDECVDTSSRIKKAFNKNYIVTFFKAHLATAQHSTANILETCNRDSDSKVATAGVSVYYEYSPQSEPLENLVSTLPAREAIDTTNEGLIQKVNNQSGQVEIPIPPSQPQMNEVYVSTVAHIWPVITVAGKDGKKSKKTFLPKAAEVICLGRLNIASGNGDNIAPCNFPGKQCTNTVDSRSHPNSLVCRISQGEESQTIPLMFEPSKGIDICFIPLQYDVSAAMVEFNSPETYSMVMEDDWEVDAPVFVVYGQYDQTASEAWPVLKGTIKKIRCCAKTSPCIGTYRGLICYVLQPPIVYRPQGGDSGSPLFTVVAGKLKLLGFHTLANLEDELYFAAPAKSSMEFHRKPDYKRTICIPETLSEKIVTAP